MLKRAIFKHIAEAAHSHHSGKKADVIVNCTGLSALKLGGVKDEKMVPARGQTVLVRNEADAMYGTSGTDDSDDEVCYMMRRAAGEHTNDNHLHFFLISCRRWHSSWRLVSEGQLGLSAGSEPGEQDHEESGGALSRIDWRERSRAPEHHSPWCWLAATPLWRNKVRKREDRWSLGCA